LPCLYSLVSVFFFYAGGYVCLYIAVRAAILLDVPGAHIKVQHAVGKAVKKMCIVRYNEHCFIVVFKKCGEVLYTCVVEVVRRLIEQKQVGVLYKCRGKQ
jgi:hypothetical protein